MIAPKSLIPGLSIDNAAEDLRGADRIEQYRLGKDAVYIPAGLRWNYIPKSGILSAAASQRTVSAGHCVTVEVKTPSLEIVTAAGSFDLHLEKQASLERFLKDLNAKG